MPFDYPPLRPPHNRDIVATVGEHGYGLAHGPKGNIKYLGAFHVDNGLAVAIVTQRHDEDYPRVALGHFGADIGDNLKLIKSAHSMLEGIEYRRGEKGRIYFVSEGAEDNMAKRDIIKKVRGFFPSSRTLTITADYEPKTARQLIIDLSTGYPSNPAECAHLHTYGLSEDAIVKRIFTDANIEKTEPLMCEIDMRGGIPTANLALRLNERNPVRDIRLES